MEGRQENTENPKPDEPVRVLRFQEQMPTNAAFAPWGASGPPQSNVRGHYAYYGMSSNIRALRQVHRAVEYYWRKMLSSRSWKGTVYWKKFQQIKDRFHSYRLGCISPTGSCKL